MEGLPAGAATMTVLFTDLVGSTAMRTRVGDDRADVLRREHDDLLGRVVDEHGGVVVKGLGDGIMAVFSAPSAAVAAAVSINQAVTRRNQAAAEPFVLRMGLSVGEVRVEGGDVFGTPVVEASRLCGRAGDEQILASVWVKALAGSRAAAGFAPMGELLLKGLVDPLETFEVEWRDVSGEVVVPFPAVPLVDRRVPLVGRQREWRVLADAWSRARAGTGPVVVLEGEPGVGTTRLAVEAARRRHDEGAVVLYGRGDLTGGPPFRPVTEALRFHVAHLRDEHLRARLGPDAATLAQLAPEVAERLGSATGALDDPTTVALRLPDAVAGWLSATSVEEPVVWLLDDLHLASPSTLALLAAALQSTEPSRLLVLVTAAGHPGVERSALDAALDEVVAGPRDVVRLPLVGLDRDDTAAMVTALLGEAIDQRADGVVARVHEHTDGLPLAVRDTVAHLLASGQVRRQGGHWLTVVDPDDLDLRRLPPLGGLAPDDRRVLEVAALAGDRLDTGLIATVAGQDGSTVAAAVDRGLALGLLAEHPGSGRPFAFAHPSVRTGLVAGLEPPVRARLAAAVAIALEEGGDDHDEVPTSTLASLWATAAEGDPAARPRAVGAAIAAGDLARARFAHHEAAHWYGLAGRWQEELTGGDDRRTFDLLLARGEAEQRAGDPDAAATLVAAARLASRHGDASELARAALAGRRRPDLPRSVPDPDQLAVLGAAARALPDDDPVLRSRVLAALAVELVPAGDPAAASLAAEAVELARGGPTDLLADALVHQMVVTGEHEVGDAPSAGWVSADGELASLDLGGVDPRLRFDLARHRTHLDLGRGDLAGAGLHLAEAREEAARLRRREVGWLLSLLEAAVAVHAGELDRADAFVEAARSLGRRVGRADAPGAELPLLLVVRCWQGRLDELADELVELVGRAPSSAAFGAAAALAQLAAPEASAAYRSAMAAGLPVGPGAAAAAGLANLAVLAALVGDRRGARVLGERLGPDPSRHPVFVAPGPAVAHTRGVLALAAGDVDAADRWFAAAVEHHDAAGAALLAADSRVAWSRALLARGEHERARVLAGEAALAARTRGATGIESVAVALLDHRTVRAG